MGTQLKFSRFQGVLIKITKHKLQKLNLYLFSLLTWEISTNTWFSVIKAGQLYTIQTSNLALVVNWKKFFRWTHPASHVHKVVKPTFLLFNIGKTYCKAIQDCGRTPNNRINCPTVRKFCNFCGVTGHFRPFAWKSCMSMKLYIMT